MQVYVEFALVENFCMDFTLLYASKIITKNRCGIGKVAFAAIIGACFAVVYPLFDIAGALAVVVKLASGCVLVLLAGKFDGVKSYIKFNIVFFALSFLLGGAIIAIFWLAGVDYISDDGYLVSSVPVGVPLFCALLLTLAVKKLRKKFAANLSQSIFNCHIYVGQLQISSKGFYDSGNCVYYFGKPVSVISKSLAVKLVDVGQIKNFVKVNTVAGDEKLAVFTADKLQIDGNKGTKVFYDVMIGVSAREIAKLVLHPDLA
jgi:stage II sporulation protein GA (sporulation sigma-E factor processing peptidase)